MRNLLAGVFCLLTACQNGAHAFQPDSATRELISKHKADVPMLVEGNNGFALALYQQLAEKDGNLFFSPYSISSALAMTYAGARGNTAAEMKTALRFQLEPERLHPTFGNLTLQMHGDGTRRPFELSIANRLWGQKDYGFQPEFVKISQDYYRAGLAEVDYRNDADEARKTINAWVERQTKSKIKDVLAPGAINGLTCLVLTNAIYLKAPWKYPFDPKQTKPDTFYLPGGKTVQTPMMSASPTINYASVGSLSLIELPYEGDDLSMVVLLPKKKDGLKDLEKELTPANLTLWRKKRETQRVYLTFPKFKVTSEFSLNDQLMQMGMRDAFTESKADFSGMATREKLSISAVVHKAFVEVNEKETEAAAATGATLRESSVSPSFHADHPFVFLIRDISTGTILFIGRITNPTS